MRESPDTDGYANEDQRSQQRVLDQASSRALPPQTMQRILHRASKDTGCTCYFHARESRSQAEVDP